MDKSILKKVSKYTYYSFFLFLAGYLFAITASMDGINEILYKISSTSFAIANVLYFIFIIIIVKHIIKNNKFYQIKEEDKGLKKTISIFKSLFIGYLFGGITLLGNSFIEVLFVKIFE